MAYGDNIQGAVTDLDQAIRRRYELTPVAQFTRFGRTSRWASFGKKAFKAKRFEFPVWHTPVSGTRRSDYATARTGAFPAARELSHKWLSYAYTDMTMFQHTCKVNTLDLKRLDGGDDAVYDLATRVISEAEDDFADQSNAALHQDTTCSMGTVAAKYLSTGGTYTSAQRYAYLQITDASIAQYRKGMILTINGSGSYEIEDVNPLPDGPHPAGGGTRVASIGPGIVVDAGSGNTCDAVAATHAIRLSGETTGDNFAGFPSWFSGSVNVYNDEDGTELDRDAIGNAWQIPYIFNYLSGSANVTFDLDTHLRPLADYLPQAIAKGRKARSKVMTQSGKAMVAIGPADIINEATQEAHDTVRFTSALRMNKDEKKSLFGDVGFEGVVWHSATLGPIAFDYDPFARPNKLDIIDPEAWHWLTDGEGLGGVQWLPGPVNGRWHPVYNNSAGNELTFYIQAGCWTMAKPYCDQPQTQIEIQGIKSSLK